MLDFVTIEDGLRLQSDHLFQPDRRADRVRGRLDAVLIAARVGPLTEHIGLVPSAIVTHTEPLHYVPPASGPADRGRVAHQSVPSSGSVGRAADVGFVTPHHAGQIGDILGEIRAAQDQAGRAGETVRLFGDPLRLPRR